MLSIVGNLKIDESKPERERYLLACIKSFAYMKDHCKFVLNLERASIGLIRRVNDLLEEEGHRFVVYNISRKSYGETYMELLGSCNDDFVLNFMEDHFSVLDSGVTMHGLLHHMRMHCIEVMKASFFEIEQKSSNTLNLITDDPYCKTFIHGVSNFEEYKRHYKNRFFLGVNFITTRAFALKFWSRDCGMRPHGYEIGKFSREWVHVCGIPNFPITAAIDDDHGEPGTCLLKSQHPKFKAIYDSLVSHPAV